MRGWTIGIIVAAALTASAAADTIELTSGELIDGAIIERSGEAIVVAHEILGRLVIPLSGVAAINGQDLSVVPDHQPGAPPDPPKLPPPPATQVIEADASRPSATAEPEPKAKAKANPAPPQPSPPPANPPTAKLEPRPDKPKPDWKHALDIGLNLTAGNVDSRNARFEYRAEMKTPENVLKFDTWYRANTREDQSTRESFSAGLFSEWPRTTDEHHNLFAQARYDYADFQSWDQRVTASGGFGWQVLDFDRQDERGNEFSVLDVTLRGGGGVRREWGSLDDELNPEGMLGTELAWRINERQSVTATSTWFPNLEDDDDYRLVNNLAWNIRVDELDGINLKFSVNHEFESLVRPGIDHNDLSAHAAVVFNF